MIRVEALPADIYGLDPLTLAARSGQLKDCAVASRASEVPALANPYLASEREQLTRWLEARATAFAPHVKVLEAIRTLNHPNASCVVADANPGLLGGCLDQWVAALQAVAVARELTTEERPVVPIVWVRSDEHNTAELISSRLLNRHNALQNVHLDRPARGAASVRSLELDEKQHGLGALREVLRQLFGDYKHIDSAVEMMTPKTGESLSSAFVRGMYELCGPLGVILVEPEDLREELSRCCATIISSPLLTMVEEAHEHSTGREYTENESDTPWVYHVGITGRLPLHVDGDNFCYEGEPGSRTPNELAAELVQTPTDWHPAHLLESLARAMVLPVIAEIGGDSELARHMLFHGARQEYDWPEPAFIPRLQLSVVDAPSSDSLQRLEITVGEVLRCQGQLDAHRSAPQAAALLEAIDQIARDARAALKEQKKALLEVGPTLKPALRVATTELTAALAGLTKKVSYVAANRGGKLDRHRRRLSNGLCPDGLRQGQQLGPFPWIAREGSEWILELCMQLDPFSGEHLAVYLD
jgi:uncharacterized protein YllA (UPF0747 family)